MAPSWDTFEAGTKDDVFVSIILRDPTGNVISSRVSYLTLKHAAPELAKTAGANPNGSSLGKKILDIDYPHGWPRSSDRAVLHHPQGSTTFFAKNLQTRCSPARTTPQNQQKSRSNARAPARNSG